MNSLFANNDLRNWSIFEEKNGAIVVRLRFNNSDTNSVNVRASHVSFKRKSENQLQRDRKRAVRHKDSHVANVTSSRSVEDCASPELTRHADQTISDTTPLEFSPVELVSPNNSPVKHDGEQQIQDPHSKLNSSFVSLSSLPEPNLETNSWMHDEASCEIDIHSDYADSNSDAASSIPSIPHQISTAEECEDNEDFLSTYVCNDEACSYGTRDLLGLCFVNISVCHKCKDVYLCEECLIKGRHHRHRPFISPSIPFLS